MLELVRVMGPILSFMLIPIWIPLAAVGVGAVRDALAGKRN